MPKRKRTSIKNRSSKRQRMKRYRRISLAGQPNRKIVKMRYSDTIELNPGLTVPSGHAFRASSIFDPDYTGVGHQPMSHDQWALFYNHYTVIGSKIRFKFSSSTAGTEPIVCGVILNDDASAPSTVSSLIEQGRGGYTMLDTKSRSVITLKKGYSARRFHNVADVKDVDRLSATFGTNPTENAFFVVWAACLSGGDPATMYGQVTIDYLCVLKEPKDFVAS